MIDPRLLLGLIFAGAWASALSAIDDETEPDQPREPGGFDRDHPGRKRIAATGKAPKNTRPT